MRGDAWGSGTVSRISAGVELNIATSSKCDVGEMWEQQQKQSSSKAPHVSGVFCRALDADVSVAFWFPAITPSVWQNPGTARSAIAQTSRNSARVRRQFLSIT